MMVITERQSMNLCALSFLSLSLSCLNGAALWQQSFEGIHGGGYRREVMTFRCTHLFLCEWMKAECQIRVDEVKAINTFRTFTSPDFQQSLPKASECLISKIPVICLLAILFCLLFKILTTLHIWVPKIIKKNFPFQEDMPKCTCILSLLKLCLWQELGLKSSFFNFKLGKLNLKFDRKLSSRK